MTRPTVTGARTPLAAAMCLAAVVSLASLFVASSGFASASSLLLGSALIAWFANELRGDTSSGRRRILWIGLLAGGVVVGVAVIDVLG